jgi:hypothetical protein
MRAYFPSIDISFSDLTWYMKCLHGKKKLMLLHKENILLTPFLAKKNMSKG